ncbi:hypothetical protein K7I13_13995 [Brucepastera parasyntrophica]|uniref:hypothetical protein n=1 Tax=Brucepastera parasyntrophica TaxID=2880008 RepID=UPI0021097E73|nr:hypothetical protein [Brucepastera parasyntrophica]ULQ59559.1 hypothetical protein K7I13_13995 [Brucepastera parasyntrophica]
MSPCEKKTHIFLFLFLPLVVLCLPGCGNSLSAVPFSGIDGQILSLKTLSSEAEKGILTGAFSSAWFLFNETDAPFMGTGVSDRPQALEVSVRISSGGPVTVTLAFVTADDISGNGKLSADPAPRDLSAVQNAEGTVSLRMNIPGLEHTGAEICGFAVQLSGGANSRLEILSAGFRRDETGWKSENGTAWFGFGTEGGMADFAALPGMGSLNPPSVILAEDSLLHLSFSPAEETLGSRLDQGRIVFTDGERIFGFRKSPAAYTTTVPASVLGNGPAVISALSGYENLAGMYVSRKKLPASLPDDPLSPVSADPHMIVEWPGHLWRRSDREVFSWDRFPSVLIVDTDTYATQSRYFKRLAFFIEKKVTGAGCLPITS